MSYIAKPRIVHDKMPRNELGLTVRDYEGGMSTLCAGCGHDSISAAVIQACFELSIPAHRAAKLSGIGCSSKTPTYFLGQSHGFNSVHGRMPSIATGANAAKEAVDGSPSAGPRPRDPGSGRAGHARLGAVRTDHDARVRPSCFGLS